ncbi:ferric-chelate reductase Frp1 [Exophiala xenobiotica]|nr:ferric-chelate reductase Frp1 [Exophiala xenobiotica]
MALHARQDMGDMDMGSMSAGDGVPGYFYMQKMFWVVIGSVIAFAALLNLLDHILLWQRQRSLNARPKSFLSTFYATLTAATREINASSLPTYQVGRLKVRSPPLGKTIVVLSYLTTICVFCFYKYDTEDQWSWEEIAYRCGCMAQTQLPLIFLLAGKQNVIGFLSGVGYERLNWLHRWVARILWLTATFHLLFFFRSWARYDYIKVKLATDDMTQTGFAAWCILTAIVATSFAPMRRMSYEVFLVSHLILFSGFIGCVMIHVDYGPGYIWACVAIFFFDRVLRFTITLFANFSFFHRRVPGRDWLWANKATLTPLAGNVTRITIDKPVLRWKPGQHVFLSCHTVVPLQSHPFSIASIPSDEKLEFLVQARRGGTRRFHRFAQKNLGLPSHDTSAVLGQRLVGVEGPYGQIRALRQFDSICFLAGSTGSTFTVPLMRDIVQRWKDGVAGGSAIVTKRIRFVWVVKARDRVTWFQNQLETVLADVEAIRRHEGHSDKELDLSIYVTCDEELEASNIATGCEPAAHGTAEIATTKTNELDNEKKRTDEKVDVMSVESSDNSNVGCGPDGTCCCRNTVDEDGSPKACCCCAPSSSSASSLSVVEKGNVEPTAVMPRLKIVAGRPKPRSIIRKVLEEADGESAVVVCGPQGLQDDVRRSVVALSDERAVHKGTGAQGIYLHVEGFCY